MSNVDTITVNKQVARDVFAAIDAQEFDRLREFWAEDMICEMVGIPEVMSRKDSIEFIQNAYSIFPDFTHELKDLIAEGDKVMARVTNLNEFEGLPPTGKKIEYASIHIITFKEGVIKKWWLLEDNFSFMTQLGMQFSKPE